MPPKTKNTYFSPTYILSNVLKTMSRFLMLNLSLMSRVCCCGSSALVLYTVHEKFLNLLQNEPLFQSS